MWLAFCWCPAVIKVGTGDMPPLWYCVLEVSASTLLKCFFSSLRDGVSGNPTDI